MKSSSHIKILSLITMFFTCLPVLAKNPIPGTLISQGAQNKIYFEKGRQVQWDTEGNLRFLDAQGKNIAQINLSQKVQKITGSEALGHDVVEEDLGGSVPTQKTYLKQKRVVKGKKLASNIASDEGAGPSDIQNTTQSQKSGVRFEKTLYQNGARKWKVLWPGLSEEIYFDLKGNIRWIKKDSKENDLSVSITQWVDGSFTRKYSKAQGSLNYTYDVSLGSARFGITNAADEILLELDCENTCEKADYTPSAESSL